MSKEEENLNLLLLLSARMNVIQNDLTVVLFHPTSKSVTYLFLASFILTGVHPAKQLQ